VLIYKTSLETILDIIIFSIHKTHCTPVEVVYSIFTFQYV